MRHGPAIGVGLVGDALRRTHRAPELLASRMPELRDKAGSRALDRFRRALEAILVFRLIAGDDRAMRERGRIDRDHLGDDHAGAALGALGEEIDPALGHPMARAVVRQGRRQRDAVAQGALADLQRSEKMREERVITHEATAFQIGFRSTSWRAMMMRCSSLVPSPMHKQRRVAVIALDVELLRIAVGAVDAHRLGGVGERGLGGGVLRHPGFHVAAPALVVGRRGVVGQRDRGLGADRHLGELELDRLVLGDRLAEGLAQLRVAHRFIERRLGDAAAARRDVDAAELEPAERGLQTRAPPRRSPRTPARDSPRKSARRSRCPCSRSSRACATP